MSHNFQPTEYKVSHYNIFSLPINEKGQRILLNTRTGKELLVPAVCYEAIANNYLEIIPKKVFDNLLNYGIFVPSTEVELETIVAENKNDIAENDTLYEVIMPSASCQLGCHYCGQQHTKHSMDFEVMNAITDRINTKLSTGQYKKLYIAWFGGEPLMALQQIRGLTSFFKELAAKHNVKYTAKMVSNGLSLKENIFRELATELSVETVEVTLDGIAEYHDKNRYTKEGHNSFDIILKNLVSITSMSDYKNLGCRISLRSNIDKDNLEGFVPLLNLLSKHNFQDKISYIYPIRIYAWGNEADLNSASKEAHATEELYWFSEVAKHKFNLSPIPKRKKTVCLTVNKDSDVYDAYGNIHNCTETPYVPAYDESNYTIGKVTDTVLKEKNEISDWNNTILEKKYWCATCVMLPICGGACPKSWVEGSPACPSFKFNMPERLLLNYTLNYRSEMSDTALTEFKTFHKDKPWLLNLLNS
jgi:uncharacterized protein